MKSLIATTNELSQLVAMLESGRPVAARGVAKWVIDPSLLRQVRAWMGLDVSRKVRLADSLITQLNYLEAIPILVGKEASQQPIDYAIWFRAAALVEGELASSKSYPALKQHRLLRRAMVALQYRLDVAKDHVDLKAISAQLLGRLTETARRWKEGQTLLNETQLTDDDRRVLEQATAYPLFVELLLDDRDLRHSFFEWALRDKLSAAIFIQYPALQSRIVESNLNGRISRMGGHMLRIQRRQIQQGVEEQVVTLPFEGQEQSLLDDAFKITLKGHYTVTVKEFFEIFSHKVREVGNLELFAQGVTNWNVHLLGWWDADANKYQRVDLSRPAWWTQLPVSEVLTLEQAIERYGDHLDGVQWNIAACATRTTLTLDPRGSHAFCEVAIPLGDGRYSIYTFGKFALRWATSLFETIVAFTDNLHATIAYPDENIYFTSRQHSRFSFGVQPEVGFEFMESIGADMIHGREGNMIYQWEGENCAKWLQDKLEALLGHERVPDLFRIPMLSSEPSDPSRHLFALLRHLPKQWHSPVLSVLHYPLGAWRGKWVLEKGKKVWRSLTNSHFWDNKTIYLPAMLHVQNNIGQFRSQQLSSIAKPAEIQISELKPILAPVTVHSA